MAQELILQLDIAQEERGLTEEEAGLRKRMKMRCLGLSSLDEQWLDSGLGFAN